MSFNSVKMEMSESFVPSSSTGGSDDQLPKTDFFDFVVSPPSHCNDTNNDENFLQRAGCRTINFLACDSPGFIKETNNNTLTALPPVSTITGSLGHLAHHNRHAISRDNCHLTNDVRDPLASDCDYWVPEDTKEQTCNILLEDLNKYCWAPQTSHSNDHPGILVQTRNSPINDRLNIQRDCQTGDRQNTDGAIYTLTVLNSEANSMDGLECCKSPTSGTGNDGSWTLRQNHLDLDAILNMESNVSIGGSTNENTGDVIDRDQDRQTVVVANGTTVDQYSAVSTPQQFTNEQTGFAVTVKAEPGTVGDNNNDWKLSDRNSLTDAVTTESAESLLRNALQGKLYPATVTTASAISPNVGHILLDGQTPQIKEEPMQTCTDEDLLLSQLDVDGSYRPADYEKLKNISEVVESYCNMENVCNNTATTIMYTIDPTSGSLSTYTVEGDLSHVGTVTVVTASSLAGTDAIQLDPQTHQLVTQQQTTPTQIQVPTTTVGGGKAKAKKYYRRPKTNANNNNSSNNSSNNPTSTTNPQQASTSTGTSTTGSPNNNAQPRKERSLHYCSICSKGFKDKYSVNVHIRTHTGEKPFACNLCGKSFRQKAHLAKHYQTHIAQKNNSNNNNNNNNSNNNNSTSGNGNTTNNNNNSNSSCSSTNNSSTNNNNNNNSSAGNSIGVPSPPSTTSAELQIQTNTILPQTPLITTTNESLQPVVVGTVCSTTES